MTELDALLLGWSDGSLAADDLMALNGLLADPANRAILKQHFEFNTALRQALAAAAATEKSDANVEHLAVTLAARAPSRAERLSWWRPWTQIHTPRRRWAWSIFATCTALILCVLGWKLSIPAPAPEPVVEKELDVPRPQIESAMSNVRVRHGDQLLPATAGLELLDGDTVEVPADSIATIVYANEATQLEIGAQTDLRLKISPHGKCWELRRGSVWAIVAPQPAGQPMRIVTADAEVRVMGTRFLVAAKPDRTRLEVDQGLVSIQRSGDAAPAEVGSGQFAEAGKTLPPQAHESPFEQFPVLSDPDQICLDDIEPGISYDAGWRLRRHQGRFYNTEHETCRKDAAMNFKFTGTGITLYGEKMPYGGPALVYLDDEPQGTISYCAPAPGAYRQVVFTRSGLIRGPHTFKVVCKSDRWIYCDAIKYKP
jgi:hypothetical protein